MFADTGAFNELNTTVVLSTSLPPPPPFLLLSSPSSVLTLLLPPPPCLLLPMQPTQDRWKEDLHESEVGAGDDVELELELELEESGGRSVVCCSFLLTHKAHDSHMIDIQIIWFPYSRHYSCLPTL